MHWLPRRERAGFVWWENSSPWYRKSQSFAENEHGGILALLIQCGSWAHKVCHKGMFLPSYTGRALTSLLPSAGSKTKATHFPCLVSFGA